MKPFPCFIGYDHRQMVAYTVAQHSLMVSASIPISITPLVLGTLPTDMQGITPFTFTRFLVPWLCDFEGPALFMDADVMVRGDVAELFAIWDHHRDNFDVAAVEHSGEEAYERASVMLFNCSRLKHMTPDWLNSKPEGLMSLGWANNPMALPKEWNHLVGYDEPNPGAKIVHFTMGVPIHPEISGCEFSDEYVAMLQGGVLTTAPWQQLMGQSKHAKHVMARNKLPHPGVSVPRTFRSH